MHAQLIEVGEARLGAVVALAQNVVVETADRLDVRADAGADRSPRASGASVQRAEERDERAVRVARPRRRLPVRERIGIPRALRPSTP